MQPVRHYSDPYQGLETQLAELKGLVRIVPPLIEADRNRRWNEIGEQDAEPEEVAGHLHRAQIETFFARAYVIPC
jgi:hypothetical protein